MNEIISAIMKSSLEGDNLNNFVEEDITHGKSYKLYSRLIARIITDLKKNYRIEIADDEGNIVNKISSKYNVIENENRICRIDLPKDEKILTECIEDISDVLQEKKQSIIENCAIGLTFGCCSRYMECSKAKECIHPDAKLAKRCQYKTNLEAGRIFYGENKNI